MKKLRLFLALLGLMLLCWPAQSSSVTGPNRCTITCQPNVFCQITATNPNNYTSCWTDPGSITCCEFDCNGNPVRDIHKICPGGESDGDRDIY